MSACCPYVLFDDPAVLLRERRVGWLVGLRGRRPFCLSARRVARAACIGGGAGALHLMASPRPAGVVEIAVVGAAIRTASGMDTPGPVSQPAQRVVMSESIFRHCINRDRRLPFINDRISQYPKRV